MSNTGEHAARATETDTSFLERYEEWYHVPVLASLFAFMLWVRVQAYENFIFDGEVLYRGNDPWYHHRATMYTVENWPQVLLFDPFTNYPEGALSGTFGTLFDQILATVAIIVGLGNPDEYTVSLVVMFSAVVFGALCLIPTYLIGKRIGGRFGALFGALILALLPGTFLSYGLVGFGDHHTAEVFFMVLGVLALMVALSVADRQQPVYELLLDRDRDALREPLGWSALAGVVIGLYMWIWPPGVLLVGIAGVFFALAMTAEVVRGRSPEPLAFVGATSMGVAAAMMLIPLQELDFSATGYDLLQPVLPLTVAVGCLFLAWLARRWERDAIDPTLYPGLVGGIALVGTATIALVLPDVFDEVRHNVERTFAFGTSAGAQTIGEAQPLLSRTDPQLGIDATDVVFQEYGLLFFTGVLAVGLMLVKPLLLSGDERLQLGAVGGVLLALVLFAADVPYGLLGIAVILALLALAGDHRHERLLLLVWIGFMTAAAFTQIRFNYYLAVGVAVSNAYLMGETIRYLGLSGDVRHRIEDIESYQILAVGLALLVVMPVLVVPMEIGHTGQEPVTTNNAMEVGAGTGPGAVTAWDGSLQWMSENTPEQGTDGGGGEPMDLYGTYDIQDSYDYPDGTYGVMSWWDYGHWITVRGERAPHANPFQHGASTAAQYLLAPDEEHAQSVVEHEIGGEGPSDRYVMVDWEMVSPYSKFNAPTVFHDDVDREDFYRQVYAPVGEEGQGFTHGFFAYDQRYYESQMVRLYHFHGSAVEPSPIVVEWDETAVEGADGEQEMIATTSPEAAAIQQFNTTEEAQEYAEENENAQVGGVGPYPEERVDALEQYRLVKYGETSALDSIDYQRAVLQQGQGVGLMPDPTQLSDVLNQHSPAWVKTFERVEGATIEGEGPANEEIRADVPMHIPETNETFVYTQFAETDDDGTFEMTVPYSTTGYDEWGPDDGYTNVSVQAEDEYQLYTEPESLDDPYWYANATVSEAQVIGEDDEPTTVELEEIEPEEIEDQLPEDDDDEFADDPDEGDVDDTNETVDDGTNETDVTPTPEGDGNDTDDSATDDDSADGNDTDDGTDSIVAPIAAVAVAAVTARVR